MTQKQFTRIRLGERGPDVSRLCLSARMFGNGTEEHEATEIIARYGEAGGNFVNATGSCADGAAERIVGRVVRQDRDRWIIAVTAGSPVKTNSSSGSGRDHWLRQTIDRNRDLLGVEKIDLFYLCFDDRMTRLEETIETLGEMIEAGKIGSWGFSNLRAWKIAELVRIADCLDVPRPIAAQSYYHALYRLTEVDYLPACAYFGIGAVAYAPFARGILSEGFSSGTQLPSYVGPQDPVVMETESRPAAVDTVRAIARHLQPSGRTITGFALQWVLANQLVSSVLIRPASLAQFDGYLSAVETSYTLNDEAFMNELLPSGNFFGPTFLDMTSAHNGRVVG
jgi:aryl-alcohol dehydrogenase-like predicted oxidoreductase